MVETRTANGKGQAAGRTRAAAAGAQRGKRTSSTRSVSRKKASSKSPATRNDNKAAKALRQGTKPLATMTESALREYFRKLNGTTPGDLYDLVMSEVERPLFRTVLAYTEGNQSRAAEILGINRGTLRKKLKAYAITTQ